MKPPQLASTNSSPGRRGITRLVLFGSAILVASFGFGLLVVPFEILAQFCEARSQNRAFSYLVHSFGK
jgi:hypothetical protein